MTNDTLRSVAEAIRYQLEKSTVRGSKIDNAAQAAITAFLSSPEMQEIRMALTMNASSRLNPFDYIAASERALATLDRMIEGK